jgi:hypothetical protein
MFERVAPDDVLARVGRHALDLAFGDSTAQKEAMAGLRTMDLDAIQFVSNHLDHPWDSALQPVVATRTKKDRPFIACSTTLRFGTVACGRASPIWMIPR